MVKEEEVGIRAFTTGSKPSLQGVLKHRYKDFIVREIVSSGPLFLTDCSYEAPKVVTPDVSVFETELKGIIGLPVFEKLQLLSANDGSLILEPIADKDMRTKIHNCVREVWNGGLMTDVVQVDPESKEVVTHVNGTGVCCVRVTRGNKRGGDRNQNKDNKKKRGVTVDVRSRKQHLQDWSVDTPPYLIFVLCKQNAEMQQVLGLLATILHMNQEGFVVSGTKDKRGVSTQEVSVHKVSPDRLLQAVAQLNKQYSKFQVGVGNFRFATHPLFLGSHKGNHFQITIRNVLVKLNNDRMAAPGREEGARTEAMSIVEKRIGDWSELGFLNYFGMQRFGSGGTHTLGAAVLRNDYRAFIKMLLSDENDPVLVEFLKTGSPCRDLQSWRVAESAVTRSLKQYAKKLKEERNVDTISIDEYKIEHYISAFSAIPYRLRTLYVHAYQSFLFNSMVSKRVELYGSKKVVAGDLVKAGENPVIVVGESDVDMYSVFDVVVPLPGSSISTFPEHSAGKDYLMGILKSDGIENSDLTSSTANKMIPGGEYRKMLSKPSNVSHRFVEYSDEDTDTDFVPSDFDVLQSLPPPPLTFAGPRSALVIQFDLEMSCYATMAFRELFNVCTSKEDLILMPL